MGSRESINPIMITLKLVSNCHDVFISGRKSSHPQNSGSKHGITFADIEASCGRPPHSLQQHHPNERFARPFISQLHAFFVRRAIISSTFDSFGMLFHIRTSSSQLPSCNVLFSFCFHKYNVGKFHCNCHNKLMEIITDRALIMVSFLANR